MKKLLSIFFASIMLFSNMGFSIASHYCQGQLVNTQLVHGTDNLGCCMAQMDNQLPEDCKSPDIQKSVKKKGCCENEYQSLDIDDNFSSKQVLSKATPQLIAVFIYVYFQLNSSDSDIDFAYSDYSPPPLEQDIQVLYQTFLL